MELYYPKSWTLKTAEKRITRIFNELSETLEKIDLNNNTILHGFRSDYLHGAQWLTVNNLQTVDFRISFATPYEKLIPQIFKRHDTHHITKELVEKSKAFQNFMSVADKKGLQPQFVKLIHWDEILRSEDGNKNFHNTEATIRFKIK